MTTARRLLAASAALSLAALALTACATPAGSGTGSTPAPSQTQPAQFSGDLEAAWLDGGRRIGVVTWGSSTCPPIPGEATAEGQIVSVSLEDPEGQPCTRDIAPRASVIGVPAGVDVTEDVTLKVTYNDATATTELDGDDDLPGASAGETDYLPSAGWFDETGFVLLTWGSSTCLPQIDTVASPSAEQVTVTFVDPPADQVCTMDMAPRATIIDVEGPGDEDDVTLTLVGGGLDATLKIAGDR